MDIDLKKKIRKKKKISHLYNKRRKTSLIINNSLKNIDKNKI